MSLLVHNIYLVCPSSTAGQWHFASYREVTINFFFLYYHFASLKMRDGVAIPLHIIFKIICRTKFPLNAVHLKAWHKPLSGNISHRSCKSCNNDEEDFSVIVRPLGTWDEKFLNVWPKVICIEFAALENGCDFWETPNRSKSCYWYHIVL